VRYGLGAILGVGEGAVQAVVGEREAHGPYRDLVDFCRRVDLKRLNRRTLEAMIRAGALDALGPNRATLMGSLTRAMQAATQAVEAHAAGQPDLFGGLAPGPSAAGEAFPPLPEWPEEQRLVGEKETLGLYLTGHPIEGHVAELGRFVTARLGELNPAERRTVVVAGLVAEIRAINSRRGRMAVVALDDGTARIDVVVYAELYGQRREVLMPDRVLVVEGELGLDERTGGPSLVASQVYDLDQARAAYARGLLIRLEAGGGSPGLVDGLAAVLRPYQEGRTPVYVEYRRPDASARLKLGEAWRVNPTDELLRRLAEVAGPDGVRMEY
jgi:DNA polymerase-3 subunit alpha